MSKRSDVPNKYVNEEVNSQITCKCMKTIQDNSGALSNLIKSSRSTSIARDGHLLNSVTDNSSYIKASLSMTSIPPNEFQDCCDIIKTKIRLERPFNSLKKKRTSDRDTWGSGYSHSSCSLHNIAGLGSGKDEFWAALQSNYNYIMDTNLLDTCKEARREIEKSVNAETKKPEKSLIEFKSRDKSYEKSPRALRKWLRVIENKLSNAPSLIEATQLSFAELQVRLAQHSVLYCEIVSHARVVGACIKSCQKEYCCNDNSLNSLSSEEKSVVKLSTKNYTNLSTLNGTEINGSLRGLERRYHLLYLKAIEIQCLFEIIIKRKSPTRCLTDKVISNEESESTDNEPVPKLARFENNLDNETLKLVESKTCNQHKNILNREIKHFEGIDSLDGIHEIHKQNLNLQNQKQIFELNFNFDADSEGSDSEILTKHSDNNFKTPELFLNKSKTENNNALKKNDEIMELNKNSISPLIQQNCLAKNNKDLSEAKKSKLIKNTLDKESLTPVKNLEFSPTISTFCKSRQRNGDVSKFNRSNRKSKNCATFYFKHSDNENEINIAKSSKDNVKCQSIDEPSTNDENVEDEDDEGWHYSSDKLILDKPSNTLMISSINDYSGVSEKIVNYYSDKNKKNCSTEKNNESIDSSVNLLNMDHHSPNTVEKFQRKDDGCTINCSMEIDEQFQTSVRKLKETSIPLRDQLINNITSTSLGEIPIIKSKKEENLQESIKELVSGAENLVRKEILKTPSKVDKSLVKKIPHVQNRVHEWLEHQPMSVNIELDDSIQTTDCEASGEYTESDSCPPVESDSSNELTDSVATCMKTCESISHFTSTEIIDGSAEPIQNVGSNQSLNSRVIRRISNRRNSDRPWSVSCLSQLTETNGACVNHNKTDPSKIGLASHSISESALNILSSPARIRNKHLPQSTSKNYDSRSTLKRRFIRKKKLSEKKIDSSSEKLSFYDSSSLPQDLKSDSAASIKITVIEDLTKALSMLPMPQKAHFEMENEDNYQLMKPNFKVGSYTTMLQKDNESKLGPLAALSNYMNENSGLINRIDDHNNSLTEQAWDNYQEKYNSENYSEGFDSDAARRLLEFGDDYRNFLDSQSDCCSSLSAANNFESFSPPQIESLQDSERKLAQVTVINTVDHARKRRSIELEYERRRKTLEIKRKASHYNQKLSNPNLTSTPKCLNSLKTKETENRSLNRNIFELTNRTLDFNELTNSVQCLKHHLEDDINSRRRKETEEQFISTTLRRRSSRTLEQSHKKIFSTSSSSNNDSEEEQDVNNFLVQNRNRLENTNALKIRSHLLRAEDYAEIIGTCRNNVRCLDSVLRGPSINALSANHVTNIRDLIVSWENLLKWSESSLVARKMQEEMTILKSSINGLGLKLISHVDSVQSIKIGIEELEKEKTELTTCRTNMLRLNASVHSWLTRQEFKVHKHIKILQYNTKDDGKKVNDFETKKENDKELENISEVNNKINSDYEFHKELKNDVSEMYTSWEDANSRINNKSDALNASLTAWKLLDCGLSEFYQVLGKDRGTLEGIEGALEKGNTTSLELANVKLVAKLLSENIKAKQSQHFQVTIEESSHLEARKLIDIRRFAVSNGSLSDSGISDGGATSDGGLSERERRLGVLRRLAKQLETALAPGSEALKLIAARMEAAEAELKTLQNTCRDLIVRTAVSQRIKPQIPKVLCNNVNGSENDRKSVFRIKKSTQSKRKKQNSPRALFSFGTQQETLNTIKEMELSTELNNVSNILNENNLKSWEDDIDVPTRTWSWRVAKIAVPMQLALFTVFCAACFMQPHCCDSINNLAMSFTPQLRYIRGPPPI